jgi:hypothetical protein
MQAGTRSSRRTLEEFSVSDRLLSCLRLTLIPDAAFPAPTGRYRPDSNRGKAT